MYVALNEKTMEDLKQKFNLEDTSPSSKPEGEQRYSDTTKEIVSKVAYLTGVPRKVFETGVLLIDVYDEMDKNKAARIVRHLCIARTSIQLNYGRIKKSFINPAELKEIEVISQYVPNESMERLSADGVNFIKKIEYKG